MNKLCISQGNVVTFVRCGGQIYNHVKFMKDSVYQKNF